jgi:hypothetical protein
MITIQTKRTDGLRGAHYIEQFDSVHEALTVAISNQSPKSSNKEGRTDWNGYTPSLENAVTLGYEGWAEVRPEVERQFGELETQIAEKLDTMFTVFNNVVGGCVDVGTYLSGRPDCMIDFMPEEQDRMGRVVKIVVNLTASAYVTGETLKKRGIVACALIDAIHKLGVGVEIWAEMAISTKFDKPSDAYSALIKVHDSSEMMDINNIMFGLCHPAMFRRVGFSLLELSGWEHAEELTRNSYGYPAPIQTQQHVGADVLVDRAQDATGDWEKDPIAWVMSTLKGLGLLGED